MRKLWLFIVPLFLFLSANLSFAATPINSIAAVVNNDIITVNQLQNRITVIRAQLQRQNIKLPPPDVLSNQVLQMMINEKLTEQVAKRMNVTATTADIQHAIKMIAAQRKMTPTQFRASLKQEGIPENVFLNQIKQQIVQQKLLQQAVASQITVTPEEVNTAMQQALSHNNANNEYHLLHILVPLPDSPSPEQINAAKKEAQNLVQQLQNGADFKSLAAAHSSGSESFSGGDMGWKKLTALPNVFAAQVMNMKKGQVSSPIQTANGFHILKLVGVRGNTKKLNKAQLKQQVEQMIFQRKMQQKQEDWLEQLRSTTYIKILDKPKSLPTPLS